MKPAQDKAPAGLPVLGGLSYCDVIYRVAKILVIDDNRMMRLYLKRCLEAAGYEVEEWVPLSAMDVPDHLTAVAPDLVLSDYQMPGCNGATLARMARRANAMLPVIILSAFKDEEMSASLLQLGVKRVLAKPIQPEALKQVIKEVLDEALAAVRPDS